LSGKALGLDLRGLQAVSKFHLSAPFTITRPLGLRTIRDFKAQYVDNQQVAKEIEKTGTNAALSCGGQMLAASWLTSEANTKYEKKTLFDAFWVGGCSGAVNEPERIRSFLYVKFRH
jgi:hypothetical protein